MKIVIIPGVGYQTNNTNPEYLSNSIKKKISCDIEIFNWDHTAVKHILETNSLLRMSNMMSYSELRDFITEAILDFEFALKYGGSINIPEADYYIGHSAGAIFSMSQDKPSTTMGSPVALVKCLPKNITFNISENQLLNSIVYRDKPILNIINRYDVIAYPLNEPNVENIYFSGCKINPFSYFPLTAHWGYWRSQFVTDEIVKHIKSVIK